MARCVDQARAGKAAPGGAPDRPRDAALAVLAATLIGFPLGELVGVHPAWVAALGALLLAVPRLWRAPADETRR